MCHRTEPFYLLTTTINGTLAELAEATHDGDFYISMSEMSALRDEEDVVPDRRLSKHQVTKNGFEFDIYTERHSALIVPYDEVVAHAVSYGGVMVASLAHLLVLKIEAYRDRRSSSKGEKKMRRALFAYACSRL